MGQGQTAIAGSPVGSMGVMLVPGPDASFPGWITSHVAHSYSDEHPGSVLVTPVLRVYWPDADIHMDRLSDQILTETIFRLRKTDVDENKGLLPSIRGNSICKDPEMLAMLRWHGS